MSLYRNGQLQAILDQARARGLVVEEKPVHKAAPPPAPEAPSVKPARSKSMNRTEREYEAMLRRQHPQAIIQWEAYTLRLADRSTYTPDFSIQHPGGEIEFAEVKGAYIFPKALVKLRIAAEHFCHRFTLAQKRKGGEWEVTELAGKWTRKEVTSCPAHSPR